MVQMVSTTSQVFFPVLRYQDGAQAIDWLERAFGCTLHELTRGPDGAIIHAELELAGAVIMVDAEPAAGDQRSPASVGGACIYVAVDDPEMLFARASAVGVEVVRPLSETDYGSRECSLRDPEGNHWSFGTYRPTLG